MERPYFRSEQAQHYDSTIALKGSNTLRVQGCAMGGMFCGGQTWTRSTERLHTRFTSPLPQRGFAFVAPSPATCRVHVAMTPGTVYVINITRRVGTAMRACLCQITGGTSWDFFAKLVFRSASCLLGD